METTAYYYSKPLLFDLVAPGAAPIRPRAPATTRPGLKGHTASTHVTCRDNGAMTESQYSVFVSSRSSYSIYSVKWLKKALVKNSNWLLC